MTFRQFTALATVAKHGNITKAAQAMRISQPSLSKQLKALEEDYRIRLFSRNGKGIQLTEDGAEFLMRIDPILAQLKNIETRYLNGSRVQEASPLRVGGTYGPSSNILPSLLAVYKKSHPDVAVTLRSNSNGVIHNLILNGELEVAVCSRPPQSGDLHAEPYVTLKLVAFAAQSDPIAKKKEFESLRPGKDSVNHPYRQSVPKHDSSDADGASKTRIQTKYRYAVRVAGSDQNGSD